MRLLSEVKLVFMLVIRSWSCRSTSSILTFLLFSSFVSTGSLLPKKPSFNASYDIQIKNPILKKIKKYKIYCDFVLLKAIILLLSNKLLIDKTILSNHPFLQSQSVPDPGVVPDAPVSGVAAVVASVVAAVGGAGGATGAVPGAVPGDVPVTGGGAGGAAVVTDAPDPGVDVLFIYKTLYNYIIYFRQKNIHTIFIILYKMQSFTQGLNMKSLMESDDYVNNTDKIRALKHSEDILSDIGRICELKKAHPNMRMIEEEKFGNLCRGACPFLYNNYTDIFNKVLKDELDLKMMVNFISILKQIEDGTVDQYDASVKVGTILKEMYVDSATRRGDNLDKAAAADAPTFVEPVKMSWSEFKKKSM